MRKRKNSKKEKKSGLIAIPGIATVLAIASVTLLIGSVMPFLLLRIHLIQTIDFEYNYDNSQQALEILMSLTQLETDIYGNTEPKKVSKIIAEYSADPSVDISFLEDELDKMASNGIFDCYKMYLEDEILAQGCASGEFPKTTLEHEGTVKIAVPSGKGTQTLKLAIGPEEEFGGGGGGVR